MSVIGDILVYCAVIIVTILVFNFLYYVPKYLGTIAEFLNRVVVISTEEEDVERK